MNSITALMPILQSAIGVLGAFSGKADIARKSASVQDAIGVVNAVVPLVRQFAQGTEVSADQVRSALAGKDAAIAAFDAEIAKHPPGEPGI